MTWAPVVEPEPGNCSQSAYRTTPLSGELASAVPPLLEPEPPLELPLPDPEPLLDPDELPLPGLASIVITVEASSNDESSSVVASDRVASALAASVVVASTRGGEPASCVARTVQAPLTHDWPDVHVPPHPPQLFGSVCSLTHALPHIVNGHVVVVASDDGAVASADAWPASTGSTGSTQVPWMQPSVSVPHTPPHTPQLFGSLDVSVQVPPHWIQPVGHEVDDPPSHVPLATVQDIVPSTHDPSLPPFEHGTLKLLPDVRPAMTTPPALSHDPPSEPGSVIVATHVAVSTLPVIGTIWLPLIGAESVARVPEIVSAAEPPESEPHVALETHVTT
jgi:hypothetical protein